MTFAQAVSALTLNEERTFLWVISGLGTTLVAIITFVGRRILGDMDEAKEERKEVVKQVKEVADDHRTEMGEVYRRMEHSNGRTTEALASFEVRLGGVETMIASKFPVERRRKSRGGESGG